MSARGRSSDTLDAYLRSERTLLAALVRRVSSERGQAYARSRVKRILDLLLAFPMSIVTVPVTAALVAVNKLLAPRLPALFVQRRVDHAGLIRVVKIRSLPPTGGPATELQVRFGQWMRRHYLDELPQMLEVVAGGLSVVGIRVLPVEVYDLLRKTWSPARFAAWDRAYRTTPLGLTGVHQVFRRRGKDDLFRFHRDMFYHRRGSLGLDLYLLWRTIRCMGRLPG